MSHLAPIRDSFSTACGEVILAEIKPEPDRLPPNEPDRAVDPKPEIR
jgi:hypothetical protein